VNRLQVEGSIAGLPNGPGDESVGCAEYMDCASHGNSQNTG
jgi:hypothetical protein